MKQAMNFSNLSPSCSLGGGGRRLRRDFAFGAAIFALLASALFAAGEASADGHSTACPEGQYDGDNRPGMRQCEPVPVITGGTTNAAGEHIPGVTIVAFSPTELQSGVIRLDINFVNRGYCDVDYRAATGDFRPVYSNIQANSIFGVQHAAFAPVNLPLATLQGHVTNAGDMFIAEAGEEEFYINGSLPAGTTPLAGYAGLEYFSRPSGTDPVITVEDADGGTYTVRAAFSSSEFRQLCIEGVVRAVCTGDKILDEDNLDMCVCPDGQVPDEADDTMCVVPPNVEECRETGEVLDGTKCVSFCPPESPDNGAGVCLSPEEIATEAAECRADGEVFDGIRCVSSCPADRPDNGAGVCLDPETTTTAAAECRANGEVFDGIRCVSSCPPDRPDTGAGICISPEAAAEAAAECRADGEVLDGIRCVSSCPSDRPANAAGICISPDIAPEVAASFEEAAAALATASRGGGGGGGDNKPDSADLVKGLSSVGAVAFFTAIYLDGGFVNFGFSPDVGYSLTESGYSYNYGGRIDFRKDRWHLYWTAGQANTNGDFGDFRYSSGGSYAADLWTAAYSENIQGETADYDVSLSANYGDGIWNFSPVYRLHSRFDETEDGRIESETESALNLEAVLRANRWTIRPTAGFQWRGMDDFADNARFKISAVRNF